MNEPPSDVLHRIGNTSYAAASACRPAFIPSNDLGVVFFAGTVDTLRIAFSPL
jgi:hypothetical protein